MRHQSELQEIIPVRVNRSPDLERKVSRGEEEDELDVKPNLNIWWVSQVSSTWPGVGPWSFRRQSHPWASAPKGNKDLEPAGPRSVRV